MDFDDMHLDDPFNDNLVDLRAGNYPALTDTDRALIELERNCPELFTAMPAVQVAVQMHKHNDLEACRQFQVMWI